MSESPLVTKKVWANANNYEVGRAGEGVHAPVYDDAQEARG